MKEHPDIILIAFSTYFDFKTPENSEKLQAVLLMNTEQICCVPKVNAASFYILILLRFRHSLGGMPYILLKALEKWS